MESGIFDQFKKRINPENLKIDQKIFVFIFFLVLSTILWFLNALNRDYISTISYPVKYVNFPSDRVLINDLPDELDFQVKSHGYNLLKYKISPNILPVQINVSNLSFRQEKSNGDEVYYVLTSSIKDLIANQLNTDIQLLSIEQDSLIFNLSEVIHKKVKVIPNVIVNTMKQYMVKSQIITSPDSVRVKGPKRILDTMVGIKTAEERFQKLDHTINEEIELIRIKNVSYSARNVEIIIPVEQFTESSIKVPITAENLPDTLNVKTFPRNVSVSFIVGLSDYERVNQSMFEAVIDFNAIDLASEENRIEVEMKQYPGFVKSMDYYPKKVEFIIEK